MARRRLGVVLLVPEPVATEVDVLRRAVGDPALDAIPPHLTLVPPVNVREEALAEALTVLRDAATAVPGPIPLSLGPVATFAPTSPTLYLAVSGDRDAVRTVREAVFRGPFHRDLEHPFHPHVTLSVELPRERLSAGVTALADFRGVIAVGRITVLEQRRHPDGRRAWEPLADAALGPRTIVGTGGWPVELADSTVADPEVLELFGVLARDRVPRATGTRARSVGGGGVLVTARRDGRLVGALLLHVDPTTPTEAVVTAVLVAPGQRGQGIGRMLVDRAARVAEARGAGRLAMGSGVAPEGWLDALGWYEKGELREPPRRSRPI